MPACDGTRSRKMADPAASPNPDLPTDTKTAELISLVATLLPLTTVVVGLRLYTRRCYSNGVGADDWVSLLSLVSCRPELRPSSRACSERRRSVMVANTSARSS